MHQRQLFSWLLLVALAAAITTGCNGGDAPPPPEAPTEEPTRTDTEPADEPAEEATQPETTAPEPTEPGATEPDMTKPEPPAEPSEPAVEEAPAEEPPAEMPPAEETPAEPAAEEGAAAEAGWGTLRGRFVFAGEVPERQLLNVNKDVEFCTTKHPLEEDLVVDPVNKGIRSVVMMLYLGRGDEPPQAHPSYGDLSQPTRMDNEWCRFAPHIQAVRAGQTIIFGNEDEVAHNVKADMFMNDPFNQTLPPKGTLEMKLEQAERLPIPVACTIHPWMTGHLVVTDHPYVVISGDDGSFVMKNVPVGDWTFQLWQEKSGYLKAVELGGETQELSRGRLEVTVHDVADAGKNDLGDIIVPVSNFEE